MVLEDVLTCTTGYRQNSLRARVLHTQKWGVGWGVGVGKLVSNKPPLNSIVQTAKRKTTPWLLQHDRIPLARGCFAEASSYQERRKI